MNSSFWQVYIHTVMHSTCIRFWPTLHITKCILNCGWQSNASIEGRSFSIVILILNSGWQWNASTEGRSFSIVILILNSGWQSNASTEGRSISIVILILNSSGLDQKWSARLKSGMGGHELFSTWAGHSRCEGISRLKNKDTSTCSCLHVCTYVHMFVCVCTCVFVLSIKGFPWTELASPDNAICTAAAQWPVYGSSIKMGRRLNHT